MTVPLLAASGVVVRRGRRDVVRRVDLTAGPGEVVAMLGPNGAGKSTLLAALGGMLPLASGRVERRGRVAAVLQTPGLARRTARANVEAALGWWGTPRSQRRARADTALAAMRASGLAHRNATTLSGGEQRRVHLARAVAVAAEVTLLDEPFDGLDPATHVALRDDTVAALRAGGGAVVIVLHDRADAWAVADRVVVLLNGVLRADAPPRDLLQTPPSAEVARFLGYDGQIVDDGGVTLTRAATVIPDSTGDLRGVVSRVVLTEDASRVEVDTGRGTVWATDRKHEYRPGDWITLRVEHGVHFDP